MGMQSDRLLLVFFLPLCVHMKDGDGTIRYPTIQFCLPGWFFSVATFFVPWSFGIPNYPATISGGTLEKFRKRLFEFCPTRQTNNNWCWRWCWRWGCGPSSIFGTGCNFFLSRTFCFCWCRRSLFSLWRIWCFLCVCHIQTLVQPEGLPVDVSGR